jgi:hypothetical protein
MNSERIKFNYLNLLTVSCLGLFLIDEREGLLLEGIYLFVCVNISDCYVYARGANE